MDPGRVDPGRVDPDPPRVEWLIVGFALTILVVQTVILFTL